MVKQTNLVNYIIHIILLYMSGRTLTQMKLSTTYKAILFLLSFCSPYTNLLWTLKRQHNRIRKYKGTVYFQSLKLWTLVILLYVINVTFFQQTTMHFFKTYLRTSKRRQSLNKSHKYSCNIVELALPLAISAGNNLFNVRFTRIINIIHRWQTILNNRKTIYFLIRYLSP